MSSIDHHHVVHSQWQTQESHLPPTLHPTIEIEASTKQSTEVLISSMFGLCNKDLEVSTSSGMQAGQPRRAALSSKHD